MKARPHDSTTPTTECTVGEVVDGRLQTYYSNGLTKREYFAGLAMQGLLAADNFSNTNPLAKAAVMQANALIEALNSEAK